MFEPLMIYPYGMVSRCTEQMARSKIIHGGWLVRDFGYGWKRIYLEFHHAESFNKLQIAYHPT